MKEATPLAPPAPVPQPITVTGERYLDSMALPAPAGTGGTARSLPWWASRQPSSSCSSSGVGTNPHPRQWPRPMAAPAPEPAAAPPPEPALPPPRSGSPGGPGDTEDPAELKPEDLVAKFNADPVAEEAADGSNHHRRHHRHHGEEDQAAASPEQKPDSNGGGAAHYRSLGRRTRSRARQRRRSMPTRSASS
jgi:hypothetical protein